MNQLEHLLEKCEEQEKASIKLVLQDCVEEYNTLRKSHPDVSIFADNLNQPSAFSEAVSGISNMFYYGYTGISSLLETAAAYSTVMMGNISNYIADYLEGEEATVTEDISNEVGNQVPSGEVVEETTEDIAKEAVEEAVEIKPIEETKEIQDLPANTEPDKTVDRNEETTKEIENETEKEIDA